MYISVAGMITLLEAVLGAHTYSIVYMENHVHSTLAINRHKKESRHGEQTSTHTYYT